MRATIRHKSTHFDTIATLSPVQIQVAIAIARGANFTGAARQAGIDRAWVYGWLKRKPAFKAAIVEAFRRVDRPDE